MNKVNDSCKVAEIINNSIMSVVYFTGMDCGACEVIKFKVEEILKKYDKIEACEINGEQHKDICAEYGVFSVPIFLLFIDGKESIRVGRNVNLLDLENKIDRYYSMIFE